MFHDECWSAGNPFIWVKSQRLRSRVTKTLLACVFALLWVMASYSSDLRGWAGWCWWCWWPSREACSRRTSAARQRAPRTCRKWKRRWADLRPSCVHHRWMATDRAGLPRSQRECGWSPASASQLPCLHQVGWDVRSRMRRRLFSGMERYYVRRISRETVSARRCFSNASSVRCVRRSVLARHLPNNDASISLHRVQRKIGNFEDDQRCWCHRISICQRTVVETDHRSGWTHIFGGKASETETSRKRQCY